ncbi:MAG: protoporphyrinogen oxidase, partial [Planococcaceae bacterium]|nr:protoporphyrinogen oxidase [Planococcaceae bacterium]
KKVGDTVQQDEIIFEISTDKVDTEIPSPASGVLKEIKFKEGDTVEVGKVVAVVGSNGDEAHQIEDTITKIDETKTESGLNDTKEKKSGVISEVPTEKFVSIEMPKMGESVMEGTIIKWYKKVGEQVNLFLNNDSKMLFDRVIFATPHLAALPLFEEHGLMDDFQEMPATSVATIAMAFKEGAVHQEKEGTGFLVSRNSDYSITACTWTHRKWPTTTPEGHVLLRGFVGRPGDESTVELSDSELEKIVLSDLKQTMKIKEDPLFTVVTRWKKASPQYMVGHKERVAKAKKELHEHFPMIKLAGSSYEGLGLPDCVDQGKAAGNEIIEELFLTK